MRRFLQVRILFVLIALLVVPTLVLPFAERLRTEWARYWTPQSKPEAALEEAIVIGTLPGGTAEGYVCEIPSRALRQQRFLEAMAQIDAARVPFPDSPPLGYPDAARWAELLAEREAIEQRLAARAAER